MARDFDIPIGVDTPADVFLKLRPLHPRCLLESAAAGGPPEHYSYDAFTYNLAQRFAELGAQVCVHRNDRLACPEAQALAPTHLCI